jgi:hypothetical protein
VLECDRPRLLSYTFGVPGSGDSPSSVRFEFEAVDESHASPGPVVQLRLTHDQFDSYDFFTGCRHAWPEVPSGLKTMLETGHSLGFNWKH